MDRRAAVQRLRRPLAVLVLLAAIPMAPLGGIWGATKASWLGIVVVLGGVALIAVLGRTTVGAGLALGAAVATWVTGLVASFVAYAVSINTSICGKNLHQGWLPPVAGVAAYLVVGSWGCHGRRALWAVPIALVAGVTVLLALTRVLPGTQGICET